MPRPKSANSRETRDKPTPRKRVDDDTRAKVIDAAAKAMAALGLEGIKARPIAQRAGISVGSIYNMFDDLDQLTRIINARVYDQLHDVETSALEKARAEGADPRHQMLALADAYLEFVESHQTLWLAVLAFNRSRREPPPKWYFEKEIALFLIIENAIAAFPGASDPTVRHLNARALWASIHGIVSMAVADGFLMQPIQDVRRQVQIIVNAVAQSLEAAAA